MRRRGLSPEIPPQLLAGYAERAWSGSFADWCRRNGVNPLAVLRASAERKRRAS